MRSHPTWSIATAVFFVALLGVLAATVLLVGPVETGRDQDYPGAPTQAFPRGHAVVHARAVTIPDHERPTSGRPSPRRPLPAWLVAALLVPAIGVLGTALRLLVPRDTGTLMSDGWIETIAGVLLGLLTTGGMVVAALVAIVLGVVELSARSRGDGSSRTG